MNVRKDVLDNGVVVLTERIPTSNSVSIGFWVKVGSKDEKEEENGYSHFVEHMLFKGTKKRNYTQIANEIDRVGAYFNASTTREETTYYINIKKEKLDVAVDILCDIIENSIFPERELKQEQNVIIEEIKMYEDSPEEFAYEKLFECIFHNHPLGRPVIGRKEIIEKITREKILNFFKKYYTPDRIIISAAGNLNHNQLLDLIKNNKFMKNKSLAGEKKDSISEREVKFFSKNSFISRDLAQVHIYLGFPSISAVDSKRFSLYVFNALFGSSISSRLFQTIREKMALCYSIYSSYASFKNSGIFSIYVATSLNFLEKALCSILKEIKKVKKYGIKKSEIRDAKEHIKGNLALAYEQNEVRMNRLAKQEIMFGKHFTYNEIIKLIDSVTLDSIMELIEIIFPKNYEIAISSIGVDEHKKIIEKLKPSL